MIDRARRAEDGSDVDQEDLRRRHYG
jgi:hypothetical protein